MIGQNKLECFCPWLVYQSRQIVTIAHAKSELLTLPTDIRLAWKFLPGKNALAYFAGYSVTMKTRFYGIDTKTKSFISDKSNNQQ
jgi:hypothetical protein